MSPLKPLDPAIIAIKSNDSKPEDTASSSVGIRALKLTIEIPKAAPLMPSLEKGCNRKRKRAEFEGSGPKANGGAGKPAAQPLLERSATEKEMPSVKRVTFSSSAQGRWIEETPEGDRVTDVSLMPNFHDRYSEERNGLCYRRSPDQVTRWPLPGALKDRRLDVALMGACITFEALLATAEIKSGYYLPSTIDCSLQQVQLAAKRSIQCYLFHKKLEIPKETCEIYANYLAYIFAMTLQEHDASESKEKTIAEFTARFVANIRLYNTKVFELTCDAFIDLINCPHPEITDLRFELKGWLESCLYDAKGDYSTAADLFADLAQDIYAKRSCLNAVFFLEDASKKHLHPYISRDVRHAPEFDALHESVKDNSWKDDEVRTITLSTCHAPEELEGLITLVSGLFGRGQVGYFFLYAARGLT